MKPCGRIVVQISSNYFLCARRVTWKAYSYKWICIVPLLSTLWPPTHPVSKNQVLNCIFLRVDIYCWVGLGKQGSDHAKDFKSVAGHALGTAAQS